MSGGDPSGGVPPGAGGGPPAVPERDRERTVSLLCAHFARDHIEVDEFERRLDLAYGARAGAELEALVSDLPALPADAATTEVAAGPTVDPARPVEDSDLLIAVMAGADRKGHWTPPRTLTVLACMGGAHLDFREARFGAPVTEVRIFALMGGAEVVVPPGVRVQVNGAAVMGAFEHVAWDAEAPADAPLIRVTGFAVMGGVEVKVRLPGESEREARRRIRGR